MGPIINTKDEKNNQGQTDQVSVREGKVEGEPIGALENYVSPSPEILQPKISQDLQQLGIKNVGLRISDSAITSGVTPANPQISSLGNLPIEINEARKLRKGDVAVGTDWEAGVEVRQVDRDEELKKVA